MAKMTTEEFIAAIKELSVLELNDLVKACEEEFGVSAAAGVVVAAAAGDAAAAEEKDEFDGICKQYGIDLISLIAPTSDERISMVASQASGFIYIVSSLGVTGVRSKITTDIPALCAAVKAATDVPCAIGFGISTPEQAATMAQSADGVIVGSAIVKIVAQYGKDAPEHVGEYVKSMVDAIR
jgi:tryptophan synthase alpha chain